MNAELMMYIEFVADRLYSVGYGSITTLKIHFVYGDDFYGR